MILLPSEVAIREVGPRDGLQAEQPLSIAERVALVDGLSLCGFRTIEAASFVSEKAVPAMGGAAGVMAAIERRPDVAFVALVPNERGAQAALAAGVDGLTVTVSASEVYSEKNTNRTIVESVAEVERIAAYVGGTTGIDAVISCAFGSPYEGDIDVEDVAALAEQLRRAGATAITLADTTGMATPRRIAEAIDATGAGVGLHLHETRGTALVNAYAALQCGVTRFDTAVGGLGGSPFAAGAGGNLATEDFVHLLDDLGVVSWIDLDALLVAAERFAAAVGHGVPSRISAAGPRSRLAN